MTEQTCLGPFTLNAVHEGDSLELIPQLPDESLDVVVTSPPYWGQRVCPGFGDVNDPRDYLKSLEQIFAAVLPKIKQSGLLWVNLGDAYNTPVNWSKNDYSYSTLGPQKIGFDADNTAYTKPRAKRKAFIDKDAPWLTYGNLLALPYRLTIALCDAGYLFRGEVIWRKKNPMPEGLCRRPHRHHESIYLFAKNEKTHAFRRKPPVGSVWEFSNDKPSGVRHLSRFPLELPKKCIEAYGELSQDTVVFDPFSGSATTGVAALLLGCSYVGFELNKDYIAGSNERLQEARRAQADGLMSDSDQLGFPLTTADDVAPNSHR